MLLRNLNTKQGLTNGTRLIIKRIHTNFLDVEIVTGSSKGRRVFLPKMTLIPSDLEMPITFRRTQFPIRLAYAMTINKSQGQTLSKVGIYLNAPCFAHGQLYVALSRARSFDDVHVTITHTSEQGKHRQRYYTTNAIIKQVLFQT